MNTESLCDAVQHNCNIVDAQFAGNFTLCIYLMKMREYCRWDKGYSYSQALTKQELGEWVTHREQMWDRLDESKFEPIDINGQHFDPFDTDAINACLLPQGLVYSGGIGAKSVPHFFLAKLEDTHTYDDYQVVVSNEECARDLTSPPAMTLHNKIFIRKESIRRMLWEKLQEWQWHKIDNAASRAFSYYDFDTDTHTALDEMVEVESQSILLHECGEIESSKHLGSQWKDFLACIASARLDLILRSVKDYYADTIITLPNLMNTNNHAALHFFAANMSPLRKMLSPSFMTAYQHWCDTSDLTLLNDWVEKSRVHWVFVCQHVLTMHEKQKSESEIQAFIEDKTL